MNELFDKIQESWRYIRKRVHLEPIIGIILGSGLGALSDAIEEETSIPYAEIPNFPSSTVKGHSGKLIFGKLGNKNVIAMAGRFHYYEGYSMQQLTFPVRLMQALGVKLLMLSNAAGGLHPDFKVGDMMVLRDHINLMPENPLRGPNDERMGTRFPDMSEPYCPQLIKLAEQIAKTRNLRLHTGVYAGVPGPCFETKAEYRYLHHIGADAVGMSTVPETIVAIHSGMQVFALSVITDLGIRDDDLPITHEEVLEAAGHTAPQMISLFRELIEKEQLTGTE